MVAEPWEETHERDPRKGTVADRFRLLGGTGEADGTGPAGAAAPPVFGTAPWGYKRAEVDAWTSWVAGLVAHGRRETVRADSAEATLRATLERLEALQPRTDEPGGAAPHPEGPARTAPGAGGGRPHREPPVAERTGPERPAGPEGSTALPRRAPRPTAVPNPPETPVRDAETARLHVVETTLHEVMTLLHRLAEPGGSGS